MSPAVKFTMIILLGLTIPLSSSAQLREKAEGPEEDREARAEWFMSLRRGPDGSIPHNALIRAKQQAEAMSRVLSKNQDVQDAGMWQWEWLGPGNIGGRIRSILIHPTHPDTMWIGGVSGGIWKTTDEGDSWFPLNDFLPSLSVTSLTMDPNDPDVIYAATGEGFAGSSSQWPGAGVFKSTNGGITWQQLSQTANWVYTLRIAHHPTQSGVLVAATRDQGLFRTGDGGQSWTTVGSSSEQWADVKWNRNNGLEVMAATLTGGVFQSLDSGQSFNQINCRFPDDFCAYNRVEVAIGPGGYRYASAADNKGMLYQSTDSGGTWDLAAIPQHLGDAGNYLNMIWVDPTDGEHIIFGGFDLHQSYSGGYFGWADISDWTQYHTGLSAHGDQHFAVERPGFGTTNYTVYFANDGGIQRADDITNIYKNSGWTNLANGLGITQFYGGAAAADGSFFIGGTQDNSHVTLRPDSSTSGWIQKFTGDGGFAAINPVHTFIQYGETQFGHPVKTTDGGETFFDAFTGLTDTNKVTAPFITPLIMDPNNPERLLEGATRVWQTLNGANNWTVFKVALAAYDDPFVSALAIAPGNSNIVWVGYANGILARTLDGGDTWSNANYYRPITDIAIDPSDINIVWVTLGGYEGGSVYYTENSQDSPPTWIQRSGTGPYALPNVHVATIQVHPLVSDWVYVGTDIGVFASGDRGQTWSQDPHYPAVGNEGPAYTQVAELFWQGDYLVAATHGRGMFRTRPAQVVYVDVAASPGGDGSMFNPFNQLTQAAAIVTDGMIIKVKNGSYDSPVVLDKDNFVVTWGGSVVIQ